MGDSDVFVQITSQTIGFALSSSKEPCKLLNALELQKENV